MYEQIVYTTRIDGFDREKSYRNPNFFDKPEKCNEVTIEGNYPDIVEAYEKLGVKVTSPQAEDKPKRIPKGKS